MRIVAAVALALLIVAPVRADEPVEPEEIVTAAKPLRDAWDRCLAADVKSQLDGDEPAAALADRALGRCARQEAALSRLLSRRLGSGRANRILAEARGTVRSGLIETIEALRPE